jgi:RNA polymerase-binding transcription factor DksA
MIKTKDLELIRKQLIRRRDEIAEEHSRSEEARRVLTEPEVEFEEMAQKESIADNLAQLDEQEKKEIDAIDQALERIKLGKYGTCEICGRPIGAKRLTAIPWTSVCSRHAKEKAKTTTATAKMAGPLPPEYEGLSGSELGDIIADELREDGDVELEELRIAIRNGELHLEGFVPTEMQHRRLLEIVQDHLDLENIVDEIIVNQVPWERDDRTPGRKDIEEVFEELEAEETDVGMGPFASRKAGATLVPPDTLVPEEK